jgi:hypothetical protein
MDNDKKEFDYFDRPEVIRKLWWLLYATCALTVVLELFSHRHPHFGFDGFFGFYAILGFVSCAVLILLSKVLALVLKAREDYYDR